MITDLEADRLADEYPNASPERKPQIETALRTWVTAAEAEAADRAREGAARLRQSFKSVSDLGGLWTKEQELRLPPTDNPDEVKARVANTAFLAEAGGMDYDTAAKTYEGLRARWAQATLGKKDAGDLEMYAEVSRQYQDGEDKAKLAFQRDADAASRGFQRALEGAPPDWSTPESDWRKGAEKAPGFDASWGFGLEQSVAYRDAFQRAFKVATEHRPLVLETLDTLKRGTKWINQGAGLSEEAAARLMELPDAERADVLRAIVAGAASMSPEDPGAAVSNLQKVFKNMGVSASRGLDALRLSKVSQALSAADAASALEAIKDGKPVYDLGGGKIATSLAAVQGAFGLEVSMQAADPVPASEIPALTKKLEGTLKFYQVTNQLEQVSRQYLDPIRPAYKTGPGWVAETMAVGLAGSAPQMVAGAIPGVGLPWMTASFVDSAYERIVADQPDIDPRSALAMATVAGTIEGGIEMLQIRNAIGLLPATSKLVQAIRTPNVNLFKVLGIQVGANIAEQNLEEALQDLALPTVKAIGAALNKDIEGVNWAQEWQEFGGTRLETFLSVLPLAILGAGAAGIRETTAFRNLLASEQALVEYGLPREVAASIAAQETPEARQAVFFEEQSKRTPESIRAGIAEAEARVARETVAATSNETPTMVYEGGKFRIVEPDGSSSMAFDDPETASLALQSRNEWEESGAAVAVRELADWLGLRDSDKRKWEVVPKIVTLDDDKLATPEQIAERMQLAGLEGLEPSEVQVFGQNVTEVRDGVVRVVNSVFIDSNPFDVIEEEAHFRFRQEMDAGIITREQAEAQVRAFQGDRAPQTFSDQALDEGVAEMVRAYFAGNFRFIQNMPQSVRSFFLRMAVFFRDAFRNAAKLKKLIREGKIDANWVGFLNRSVGLTEAVQEQEAAAKAAQDLTGQPAEIVTRFSIGARQVSETDRKYLDAVNRGDMETAQKMVDEAAKEAGYDSPKVYHGTGAEFTVFERLLGGKTTDAKSARLAIFFTTDEKTAQSYAVYASESGPVRDLLAKAEKAEKRGNWAEYERLTDEAEKLDTYDSRLLRRQTQARVVSAYLKGDFATFDAEGKTPKELADDMDTPISNAIVKARRAGKNGVLFKSLDDAINLSNRPADHYAVFNPSQIKSADPVTRDDVGNIIPLSERFNPKTQDIRFSVGKKKKPKEETAIDERHLNLAPAEYIGGRGTVSTRVPTAKKAVESEEVLHINLEAINQSEELKAKLAQNLRDGVQEGGRSVKYLTDEQAAGTDDEVIRHFIDLVKSNLLWLWDKFPEEYKERAKLWYVGANKIAEACAEFYGVTVEQAAGVLAVESPQKDWFQNVSMAERIMRIWKRAMKEDFVFTQERFDYCYNNDVEEVRAIAESEFKPRIFKPKKWSKRSGVSEEEFNASEEQRKKDHRKKERERKSAFLEKREEARVEFNKKNAKWEAIRPRVIGKPWSQLDYDGKARLFRALDEMEGDRSYRIILPEGGRGEIALTSKGEPVVVAWSSYNFIAKAFSILDDGSLENISRNLGEEHKVRNFFNNISDPHNAKGYVTIDTHAIAAALLNSLSGTSKEVKDNFGAAGGDSFVGVGGTYGIYATAYKELADELSRILGRQVLAREVQSVTWEAVRLLFTKEQKTSGKLTQQLDALWNEHAEGKAGIDDVRRRIWDLSGGIQPPSWADTEFGYDAQQSGVAGSVLDGGPFIPLGRRAGGADSSMDPREGSLQQEGIVRGSNPTARFSVGRKAAPYAEQLAAQMDALKTKPTVRIQIYERARKKFTDLVARHRAAIAEAQAADTRKPADIIEEAKATHDAEVARLDEERDAAIAAATTDKQRNTARLVHGTKLRAANMALSKALAAATGEGTRQARTAQVVGELNAILSAFPAEVRGRVGGFVQLVQRKTEKAFGEILSKRIAKAEAELERLLKREYIERIDSTLERLEPKLSEGKVQSSNLGPEAQAYVDAVAAVVNMSEDEVTDEIARIEGLFDRETEPDKLEALLTRLEIANQYGNLEERTSAELASALENLQVVARGGREKWKIQEEARKEANNATATKILERLGFKNGRKPQDSDLQNAKERAKTFAEGAIDFVESNLSWPQTLQEVFKSAKDEVALYFEDLARKSTNALTDSLVKVSNRFNSEMNSRLGVKNRRERLKVLARLSETKNTKVDFLEGRVVVQEKIDIETARILVASGPVLGEFTLEEVKLIGNLLAENDAKPKRRQKKSLTFDRVLSEGKVKPQRMTELEAVQYLLSWAQPDIRPRMERQGIGQDAIDGLEKFISKEARAIMGFLQEEYARGYTRLNEVYRRLFGMNMPRVENYSPARYDVAGADNDVGGPLDMGGGEGAGMSSGFVKTRQKHNARLARVDALSTYFQHVQNSEYWMAWAENVREMKATLGRTEVLQAIRSTAGLGKEEAVKKWVKAFETNGRKDAAMFSVVTKLLNYVMAAHSKIALAWKVAVLMKQASAALGSTMEIPPGAAVLGWGRFLTRQLVIGLKDVWNSPTIQRRIESGFSPEVRTAMAADGLSPSMLASLGEKGMLPIVYTDAAFTTISAAIAYDYHYRKAVDSGVSPEAAKEVAMDAMDRTIHRTAQPAENVDRSLNEVNASVWAKLFMQFKSEARKNFAISYLAAKRIGRGEDVAANAKTLAVSWALGGLLTQTMGDLYRSIFKDDDDEDLWQPEDYMRALVLGPIDGLFLYGQGLSLFVTGVTGGKMFRGKSANPIEQAMGDMLRKNANPANWEGWQDAYSGMLLWIQTVARLTGSKTMTGVGTLGNAGKTLVELAEE